MGLLDFVRTNLLRQRVALVPVPDISQERLRWFEHFDEDKTGTLKQEELVRTAPRQNLPCICMACTSTWPCTHVLPVPGAGAHQDVQLGVRLGSGAADARARECGVASL